MPEPDPNEPVRVKDKDTGHVYTIRRISLPHGNYQELKADAVNANTGEFLPPVYAGEATPAATSKES